MELFGELERFASDLYPYRWIVTAGLALALVMLCLLTARRGWHHVLWRRRVTVAIVAVPVLAIMLPVGYYTLSPLWTRTHLEEESPLALLAATVPEAEAANTPTVMPPVEATPTSTVEPMSTEPPIPTATEEPVAAMEPTSAPDPSPTVMPEPMPTEAPVMEPTSEPEPEPTPEPESQPTEFVPHVVLTGEFAGADDFHFGSGTALLIETMPGQYVFRVENFTVRNGPDLFVYLSTNPAGWSEDALNLGELKATDGAFNYDIPPGTDISIFKSAIVWCREFAVLFSTATFAGS